MKENLFKRGIVRAFSFLLMMLVAHVLSEAHAQQTIFNVPTSDTLERGKMYVEMDATFKPVNPKFSSFVPRIVFGLGGGVEAGVNLTGNIQPGKDATTIVPALKWKVYDGGDSGWAFVAGSNLFIPLRNRAYRAGNYTYAQTSKALKTGTRLTAGGYYFSADVVASGAHRAGGQFGIEHSLDNSLTIAADWFTGRHANGYFTPGLIFKPHRKVTVYSGYSIGNGGASRGNHFFLVEAGVNIN